MPHGKGGAGRAAREDVSGAAAGRRNQKGYRDDMVVGGHAKGIFARGRGPGRKSGVERRR